MRLFGFPSQCFILSSRLAAPPALLVPSSVPRAWMAGVVLTCSQTAPPPWFYRPNPVFPGTPNVSQSSRKYQRFEFQPEEFSRSRLNRLGLLFYGLPESAFRNLSISFVSLLICSEAPCSPFTGVGEAVQRTSIVFPMFSLTHGRRKRCARFGRRNLEPTKTAKLPEPFSGCFSISRELQQFGIEPKDPDKGNFIGWFTVCWFA